VKKKIPKLRKAQIKKIKEVAAEVASFNREITTPSYMPPMSVIKDDFPRLEITKDDHLFLDCLAAFAVAFGFTFIGVVIGTMIHK